MQAVQQIYEQYKALPEKAQKELKTLIVQDDEDLFDDISLPHIKQGLEDIKLLRQGKLKTIPAREALSKIRKEYDSRRIF